MRREVGIRNSAEFIVRVREFWSCYLFIELMLYVLSLVAEAPRSVTKVFGSQLLLPGHDGSHWCVLACESKFFANYCPVNIRRRRPVTRRYVCRKVFSRTAIETLTVFPFYPANVYANGRGKFSLRRISLTFSHRTSRIRQAAQSRFPRAAALNGFSKITSTVSVAVHHAFVSMTDLTLFRGSQTLLFNFISTYKRKLGTRRLFHFQQFCESDRFGHPLLPSQ